MTHSDIDRAMEAIYSEDLAELVRTIEILAAAALSVALYLLWS